MPNDLQGKEEYSNTAPTIHDYLVLHTDNLMRRLRDAIHKGLNPNPVAMFWPRAPVRGDDGSTISRLVGMDLAEEDLKDVKVPLRVGVDRTNAYAVLLIVPSEECVKGVLETPAGTMTWTMRKQRRGDSTFIQEPVRHEDVDVLGLIQREG